MCLTILFLLVGNPHDDPSRHIRGVGYQKGCAADGEGLVIAVEQSNDS